MPLQLNLKLLKLIKIKILPPRPVEIQICNGTTLLIKNEKMDRFVKVVPSSMFCRESLDEYTLDNCILD